jgi:copper chaperone CopZ
VIDALRALPGVRDVAVDLQTKRVTLEHDAGVVDESALRQAIADIGFAVGAFS